MKAFQDDFGPFNDHVWINAASMGPLPRVAIDAALEVINASKSPANMDEELFNDIPIQLKHELGKLIHVPANEIILGNSASYGLHLWANGLPLKKGDEVIVVKGDFPASILPWLNLRKKGIVIHEVQPQLTAFSVDDLQRMRTEATKLVCGTWVDSFTGNALDLMNLSKACHEHDIWFMLNGTQAIGAQPLDLTKIPIDGIVSSGYKWMCGPYSTGFCWLRPEILHSLDYNQAYWIPMQGDRDLDQLRDYQLRDDLGAEKYDVFCTANPFNFIPWTKSIEYLNIQGLSVIQHHNDDLVAQFIETIDRKKYTILSPEDPQKRTAIIIISHHDSNKNKTIFEHLTANKIDLSFREGNLRFAPHLYNTPADILRVIEKLNSFG